MIQFYETYRGLIILVAISILALIISRHLLYPFFKKIAKKSSNKFDDLLIQRRTIERAVHIVPAIILYVGMPHVLASTTVLFHTLYTLNNLYFIFIGFLIFDSFLHACADHILLNSNKQGLPIQGVRQAILLVGFLACAILVISQITGKSPVILLSGLGALAAVFMLIFRDPILGFTAGIQIAMFDLVRTGDWIEVSKEGIDGTVDAVSLTSIRISNWDNTTSVLPTYSLVSTTFKNWRQMQDTSRRRVQRSILIDANSLHTLSANKMQTLEKNPLYAPALQKLSSRLSAGELPLNLTAFRLCIDAFLRSIPEIDPKYTLIVREKESNGKGIPLEIYIFTSISQWAAYEDFSSTLVDRLIAKLPEFDLKLYQLSQAE